MRDRQSIVGVEPVRQQDDIAHARIIGEHRVEWHGSAAGTTALVEDVSHGLSRKGAACVSFLDRSIFPALIRAIAPGGALVYETFTVPHLDVVRRGAARGPRNVAYLLEAGEIARLVAPLEIQEHEEGLVVDDAGERYVARVMAIKR